MFGFSDEDTSVSYGAIIDVGSGSVGVGIVESDPDKEKPVVLFSHRELMRVSEDESVDTIMRKMREALFSASLILSKDGLSKLKQHNKRARIRKVLVTCSSPWAYTISKKVRYTNDEEFVITENLVEELVEKAEQQIESDVAQTDFLNSMGLKIVERATIHISINDYVIHKPIGLRGESVSLSHITGLIPEDVLNAVYEVREKILTRTEISTHTFMLVSFCVLRDLFPESTSLTIIDVAGESTEIGIVRDSVLLKTTHIPYGSNTLIRNLAKQTKGSPDDIASSLRALAEQAASDDMSLSMNGHLKEYGDTLRDAVAKLHADGGIPNTLAITALPSLDALFQTCIPEIFNSETNQDYSILNYHDKVFRTTESATNHDVFITIASRFFHKLHGCGE